MRREGVEPSRPKALVPGTSASACFATSAWSGYRESDPGLHHGKVMRYHYATAAGSPQEVPILRPRPYQGRAPPLSYEGTVPGAGLEPACAGFKVQPGCQQPTPEQSRLPVPIRASRLTGARSQPCATAVCARRESNPQHPAPRADLSAVWSTSTWSRHPVPTRAICRTKAEPQPCAAASLPGLGSNQRGQDSESCWEASIPPGNGARGGSRTHIRQFLGLAALPVGCTRAQYAASGSNGDRPG